MSSHTNCSRCQRPLTQNLPGELCETCRNFNTSPTSDDSISLSAVSAERMTAAHNGISLPTPTAGHTPCPQETKCEVPGYQHMAMLGDGGMGIVYQVREEAADRVVALKLIKRSYDPAARNRFQVEVRALARLDHPNIVRIHTVQLDLRDPYFTMEFVDGTGLDVRLKSKGPLPIREAVRILEPVSRAVHAAHQTGVIHRDLKPSNILLASDGTPKVTDFGLAKRLDIEDNLTISESLLGTPEYMSPEQASRKNLEIGPLSDVYGLGATLYALLTGRPPFRGENTESTLQQVREDLPKPPRTFRADIPVELEAICLKCLEKNPLHRYSSAEALADDLARWQRGEPTLARPATYLKKVWHRVRKNGRKIAALCAVLLIVSSLITLAAAWPGREKPAPPEDPKAAYRAQIQKDLADGKEVTLVGPTGLPGWHDWIIGSPELGKSATGDGTCTFEAIETCILDLCPDPQVNRYSVRADIRFVDSKVIDVQGNPNKNEPSLAGLFVARRVQECPKGVIVHSLVTVTFSDDTRVTSNGQKSVDLTLATITQSPGLLPGKSRTALAQLAYTPPKRTPGPWRTIELEFSEEGCHARWIGDPNTAMTPIGLATNPVLVSTTLRQEERLRKTHPDATVPKWEPRGSVGIWGYRAAIDFCNVILRPHS